MQLDPGSGKTRILASVHDDAWVRRSGMLFRSVGCPITSGYTFRSDAAAFRISIPYRSMAEHPFN